MQVHDFETATRRYEDWLRGQLTVIKDDLRHKYRKMRKEGIFTFFRGTFYRWVELWGAERRELRRAGVLIPKAPEIFCVGDLHVENFGTWRDAEGRLAWGINDFDEAYPLRYTNDLVRLATSAFFAVEAARESWTLSHEAACAAILAGYRESLASGGRPFVLARSVPWLWNIATNPSRTPEEFWNGLQGKIRRVRDSRLARVVKDAARVLKCHAPGDPTVKPGKVLLRQAGVGSLGRPRFVQLFEGRNGQLAREAKAIAPSAAVFAGLGKPIKHAYEQVLRGMVRIPDPFFGVDGDWVVRRLAFDSDKIALDSLRTLEDVTRYFHAMGTETANVHFGSGRARALAQHLALQCRSHPQWLCQASTAMARATRRDFAEFRKTRLGIDRKP